MPVSNRDTYKYLLVDGNEVVYVGITNDLERRNAEHRSEGKEFTDIVQDGEITTRDAAEKWEEKMIAMYKNDHNGKRPKYNQNDSGK